MANSGARPWAVGDWLQGLGLGRYEADFRENAVDADILRDLTDQDLEKLGVVLGDRRRLLRAIAVLDDAPSPAKLAPGPLPVTFAPVSGAVTPPISAAIEVSGEGRHVTVMFCGLVDSTGIVGKLDAEEWCDLVGAYFEAASLAVTEMGGKVAKKLGNGLVALFGYPLAHENDVERAAHAARAVQRALTELNCKYDHIGKPALAARITIDSGPLVVDAAGEILGDLPNISARPQAFVEPTPVLVPRRVQRQISGPLVAEELGSDELKGVLPAVTLNGNILASGGGYPTTDYHRLITRAVGALDRNTAEARRALYERARNALLAELRSREPAFLATDITKQRLALENAIREVEADAWQVRASEPACEPEDEAVPLPLRRHTLTAPEVEEEQNERTRHQLSHRGPPSLPRPDWSRPLPQLLIVSGVMTVATLNDARVLIEQHLPAASRAKDMWRYVSDELRRAALGRDAAEFSSVMEMALSLEGLEWSLQ
jgi:class 3 adenylate cyclase